MSWGFGIVVGLLVLMTLYDVVQKKHAILRNFPVIGHFRYLLELVTDFSGDRGCPLES